MCEVNMFQIPTTQLFVYNNYNVNVKLFKLFLLFCTQTLRPYSKQQHDCIMIYMAVYVVLFNTILSQTRVILTLFRHLFYLPPLKFMYH